MAIHCVPAFFGWLAVITASNLPVLLLGRFLTGISVGMLGPPSSVTIGETSEPAYRGLLLAGISLAISMGILVVHVIGTFLTWKSTAIICGVFPIITYILIATIPESPAWLMRNNRHDEAKVSYKWLRGIDNEVLSEFDNMVKKHELDNIIGNSKQMSGWDKLKTSLKTPEFLRPLGTILGFFFVMQFSGVNVVAFYTVSIMKDILGDSVNEYLSMIIIDTVRVVMSIVACVLTRTMYRRSLTILSGSGTALCMIGLSVFMYYSKRNSEVFKDLNWISLIFLIGYICFLNCGLFALPWILNG